MDAPITPEYIIGNASFVRDLGFCQVWKMRYGVLNLETEFYIFERDGKLHWSEKAPRKSWRYFADDNNVWWCWNLRRVYGMEAEIEMELRGELTEEFSNGYPAESLEEVKAVMIDGGYIEE